MFVQKIHDFPILQYKKFLSIYGDIFVLICLLVQSAMFSIHY